MLIVRRIPIVLALIAGGLALLFTALSVSAKPLMETRTYPGPAPCATTLQACISASSAGDQINIAAGVYTESLILTRSVSLVGAGIGQTVLSAPVNQRTLLVSSIVTSGAQISDLTINAGALATGSGAGVLVQSPAQPTLHNLLIQNGVVTASNALGGGLFTQSSLTLTNVTFFQNVAFAGKGGGLAGAPGAHLTLINVTFDSNSAENGGGGLYVDSATLSGATFQGNVAGSALPLSLGFGGGANITGTVTLVDTTFAQNTAFKDGGGLYAGGHATVNGGTFSLNTSVGERAGALAVGGDLLMDGTVVTGSLSFDSGGAMFIIGTTTIHNALLAENRTTGGAGGALRANGASHISNTQFFSNTSLNQGGGMRGTGPIFITNTSFLSNTSTNNPGGGLDAVANAFFFGGSFVGNSSPTLGGGARVLGTLELSGTVFSANTAGLMGGGLRVTTATVENAVFDSNRVLTGNGGGLAALNVLTLTRTIFTHNAVLSGTQTDATGAGGGLFGDGLVTSTDNVFFENFALRLGGGMDADDLTSVWDQFRGNFTGPQGSGGGLFVAGGFGVEGALFYTNTANTGGGMGVNSTANGAIQNSLFARNVVTFADGGAALRLLSANQVHLAHNTLVGTNQPGRAAVHMQGTGDFFFSANIIASHAQGLKQFGSAPTSTVTTAHTLFFSVTTPYIGPVSPTLSDITGTVAFIDPATDDYRLGFGSAAIDAAPSYGLVVDFEGQPRPMGLDFDIGFDEALPARVFLPVELR